MYIYIAAPLSDKRKCQQLQHALEYNGHTVTASWIRQDQNEPVISQRTTGNSAWLRNCVIDGLQDFADIDKADLVVFIGHQSTAGGLWVELGYSIASGKRILWTDYAVPNVFAGLVAKLRDASEDSVEMTLIVNLIQPFLSTQQR